MYLGFKSQFGIAEKKNILVFILKNKLWLIGHNSYCNS